jgi:hypothetical protein
MLRRKRRGELDKATHDELALYSPRDAMRRQDSPESSDGFPARVFTALGSTRRHGSWRAQDWGERLRTSVAEGLVGLSERPQPNR